MGEDRLPLEVAATAVVSPVLRSATLVPSWCTSLCCLRRERSSRSAHFSRNTNVTNGLPHHQEPRFDPLSESHFPDRATPCLILPSQHADTSNLTMAPASTGTASQIGGCSCTNVISLRGNSNPDDNFPDEFPKLTASGLVQGDWNFDLMIDQAEYVKEGVGTEFVSDQIRMMFVMNHAVTSDSAVCYQL